MNETTVKAVLSKYNIKYKKILPSQSGYRNEIWPIITNKYQTINLTFFKQEHKIEERIKRASEVSGWLAQQGLPCRVQIDPRLIVVKSGRCRRVAGLFDYLSGDTIAWESYTKKHLKVLGYSMAIMHNNLANYTQPLPSIYDEISYITKTMINYFTNRQIANAIAKKLQIKVNVMAIETLNSAILSCKHLSNQQALHMDFVRGNILYSQDKTSVLFLDGISVSGILDFEKTAFGYVGIDIGRTLAFLYVDCKNKSPSKVYRSFLLSGYYKNGLSTVKLNNILLTKIILYFLLYDFYKFMAHNPYQDLYQNQHFLRTKKILLQFDIIKYEQVKG